MIKINQKINFKAVVMTVMKMEKIIKIIKTITLMMMLALEKIKMAVLIQMI